MKNKSRKLNEFYRPSTKREKLRYYKSIIPQIREIARECGYAIAIHGSMTRDLDIMAMPWVKNAKAPETLARNIMLALMGYSYTRAYFKEHRNDCCKPHNRLTYAIPTKGRTYIDMSVMPRAGYPQA